MAPKRNTRVQRDSEPPADPPTRQTRGKKRRTSDASEVSTQSHVVSSEVVSTAPAKRRKQQKHLTVEPTLEEDEADHDGELVLASDIADSKPHITVSSQRDEHGNQSVQVFSQTSHTTSRGVHFDEVESEGELNRTTAHHITPHPRKIFSFMRRITGSPALSNGSTSRRVEVKTSRQSLPPSLSQNESGKSFDVEELRLQYAPLHEVLQKRIERRAHIKSLSKQLKTLQQQGDDAGAARVQEELDDLHLDQYELAELTAGTYDDDVVVLDSQEITYPRLPIEHHRQESSSLTSFTQHIRESFGAREESFPDTERRKLEDAILQLSNQANTAREEKKLLEQELLGLGLAADEAGDDPRAVLESIRRTFREIRLSLSAILPGDIDESYSNLAVVELLVANVREFAGRLRELDKTVQDRTNIINDEAQQIHYLIGVLATAQETERRLQMEISALEIRVQSLNKRFAEVDRENEAKGRDLEDMEEQRQVLEEERDDLQTQLNAKAKENKTLYEEKLELAKNVVRLNESLRGYQAEKSRLEVYIIEIEELSAQRQKTIEDLNARILGLDREIESTRAELLRITALYEEEQQARTAVEEDLQGKTTEVGDLESRVEVLEDELERHAADLEELRRLNATEREQRENAEAELDTRGEEVERLEKVVEEKGLEANQLRQKIFEIQQKSKAQVEKLEKDAEEREERFQRDFAEEVERREVAEEEAADRKERIGELEAEMERLNSELLEVISERDAEVARLTGELESSRAEVDRLGRELEALSIEIQDVTFERDRLRTELETTITTLQQTITTHINTISALETEAANTATLHDSETDDFRRRIADLHQEKSDTQHALEELEAAQRDLEAELARERADARATLAAKDDEIRDLQEAVLQRDEKLLLIVDQAADAERLGQAQLRERDARIAELEQTTQVEEETVTTLRLNLQALQGQFREYARRCDARVAALQAAVEAARQVADEEAGEQGRDSEGFLKGVEEILQRGELKVETARMVRTMKTSSSAHQEGGVNGITEQAVAAVGGNAQQNQKKGRGGGGRKKRVQDSGFYEAESEAAL